jgi:tRNA dimethylallyltransferase
MKPLPKLLIVCGPTATGKTALAAALANAFDGELINADSRQVYTGLDVLTGKDRDTAAATGDTIHAKWNGRDFRLPSYTVHHVPIWLYDVVSPEEMFNVGQYESLASQVIADVDGRGKLPIVVGGTGLYIDAIVRGIPSADIPPDLSLRARWESASLDDLQKEVTTRFPVRWERMNNSDRNNPRRLIRVLETGGIEIAPRSTDARYDCLWIGLTGTLSRIQSAIDARVRMRWVSGAREETDALRSHTGSIAPALSSCGIEEIAKYRQGIFTEEEALAKWALSEFQYAKRQLTWFKKQSSIAWFESEASDTPDKVENTVRQWYTTDR